MTNPQPEDKAKTAEIEALNRANLRRVVISFELLRQLFAPGAHPPRSYRVVRDAIPEDAELVNVQHAWPNCVELLLRSDRFTPVKLGDQIPQLDILVETSAEPSFQSAEWVLMGQKWTKEEADRLIELILRGGK